MARKPKKKSGISVDLSDVETWFKAPAGHYALKVVEVSETSNKSLAWDFEITDGKFEGKKIRDYTSLEPKQLFRLRGLVEALGLEIPDEAMDLDFEELVDMEVEADVAYREWEGDMKVNFTYYPADGEPEEKPAKSKKAGKKREEPEEEEKPARKSDKAKAGKKKAEVELTQEEIRDMDVDELEALVEEHSLEVDLSDHKTLKKQQNAVIDAAEAAGLMAAE